MERHTRWIGCVLLLGLAGLAPANAPAPVPLPALARELELTHHRDAATDREFLAGRGHEVVLAPGLATILLDGRPRRFAEAVEVRDGVVVVPAEAARWLTEALSPPPPTPPDPPPSRDLEGFRLTLDPGHGGKNTGASGHLNLVEKEINLDVGLRVAELLRARGADVVLTRATDRHLDEQWRADLQKRVDLARDAHAFVSIHANWAASESARGFEIYTRRSASAAEQKLAAAVRGPMAEATPSPDRGIKPKDYIVLENTACPAILIEMDFISNPESARLLASTAHRDRLAGAIARGIGRWRLDSTASFR